MHLAMAVVTDTEQDHEAGTVALGRACFVLKLSWRSMHTIMGALVMKLWQLLKLGLVCLNPKLNPKLNPDLNPKPLLPTLGILQPAQRHSR